MLTIYLSMDTPQIMHLETLRSTCNYNQCNYILRWCHRSTARVWNATTLFSFHHSTTYKYLYVPSSVVNSAQTSDPIYGYKIKSQFFLTTDDLSSYNVWKELLESSCPKRLWFKLKNSLYFYTCDSFDLNQQLTFYFEKYKKRKPTRYLYIRFGKDFINIMVQVYW